MSKLLKAAAIGAGIYGLAKTSSVAGYWYGTLKTMFILGANPKVGHKLVDDYAEVVNKWKGVLVK